MIPGIAFKRDDDDVRRSPALKVMELLHYDGARNIAYNDPFVPAAEIDGQKFTSVEIDKKMLQGADCVLITTNHSSYDYDFIVKNARRVIDARNATKNVKVGRNKIVLLGDGK